MPRYLGDYRANQTIDFTFTTLSTALTGAPGALSSGDINVYKANSATQSTAGITLTATFDSIVGLNHVRILTTSDGTFYADGSDYNVIISTGAVGSVSLLGYTVASFSLNNRSALVATSTGRTLDVSAGGEAGLDWANIGSPTANNTLSGTIISSSQAVAVVSSVGPGAVSSSSITIGAYTNIADALLDRDMILGTDSGTSTLRTPRQALRFIRNKWVLSTTNVLTVYKEDDTATSWTGAVTASTDASPITASDPTG